MPNNYNSISPALPQCEGTRLVPRTGILRRTATNGGTRLRATQSANKHDPVVVHGRLSSTQVSALLAFYSANRAIPFYFTIINGSQQTVVFSPDNPYDIKPVPGQGYSEVSVNMLEV